MPAVFELTELVDKVERQTLETMRAAHKAAIEGLDSVLDRFGEYVPEWPAERLPRPGELVDKAFDFAEKVLAEQHAFATDVTMRLRKASVKSARAGKAPKAEKTVKVEKIEKVEKEPTPVTHVVRPKVASHG